MVSLHNLGSEKVISNSHGSVIDTLGKRIFEFILPIPKDKGLRERIAREIREAVLARVALRNKTKQISLGIEGITEAGEEDKELLETI